MAPKRSLCAETNEQEPHKKDKESATISKKKKSNQKQRKSKQEETDYEEIDSNEESKFVFKRRQTRVCV